MDARQHGSRVPCASASSVRKGANVVRKVRFSRGVCSDGGGGAVAAAAYRARGGDLLAAPGGVGFNSGCVSRGENRRPAICRWRAARRAAAVGGRETGSNPSG